MKKVMFILNRFTSIRFLMAACLVLSSSQLWAFSYKTQDVPYNFQDISDGEPVLENCDDCARAVDIGFPFTFYGRSYTEVYVSSNGFLIPGGSDPVLGERIACCHGRDIPYQDNIVGVIAPWWTDLSMEAQELSNVSEEDGAVFAELQGVDGNYVFIVQFNKVRNFYNPANADSNTFQVKFFQQDNRIEFHYQKLAASQGVHTIGIESPRQDAGEKVFRTKSMMDLPSSSESFALRFSPQVSSKVTSSMRYAAAGNRLAHVFEVDQTVNDISEISFEKNIDPASLANDIDFNNASLLSNTPARFALTYTLFNTLSGETGGTIGADLIEFSINGAPLLALESQTIFIQQAKVLDDEEATVRAVALNHDATLAAFKSEGNLLDTLTKSESAGDVFFIGRDPDTLVEESHQLTELSGSQQCGTPYIDDSGLTAYLFVICQVNQSVNSVSLLKFSLDSYLDDELDAVSQVISGTTHVFNADLEKYGYVVSANGQLAYARDNGSGFQDVILEGSPINVLHGGPGLLSSLAINEAGSKLIYVLDNELYFYDGTEVHVASNVSTADLSMDGTTIAFSSTSDLSGGGNADGSEEVFTTLTETPFLFTQVTNQTGGACKLPQLSKTGIRLAYVCNIDLLQIGNDFSNREAVYITETTTGEAITHLLGEANNVSTGIDTVVMSGDGATISFEDTASNNAFRLIGLSKLDGDIESTPSKIYPVPFKLPGDGKNGALALFSLFLLLSVLFRRIHFSA